MADKIFTEEEQSILLESPFVIKVTRHVVYFTAEFKRMVYEELVKNRKIGDILVDLGIDPAIIGEGRMNGLRISITKTGREGMGFSDILQKGARIPIEDRVRHLEQQLAYKNQEVEFLKKIVSLGTEGDLL